MVDITNEAPAVPRKHKKNQQKPIGSQHTWFTQHTHCFNSYKLLVALPLLLTGNYCNAKHAVSLHNWYKIHFLMTTMTLIGMYWILTSAGLQ